MSNNDLNPKEKDSLAIVNILALIVAVVTYLATDIGLLKAIGVWFAAIIAIACLYLLFGNRKE